MDKQSLHLNAKRILNSVPEKPSWAEHFKIGVMQVKRLSLVALHFPHYNR